MFLALAMLAFPFGARAEPSGVADDIRESAKEAFGEASSAVQRKRTDARQLARWLEILASRPDQEALAGITSLVKAGNSTALNFMGWLLDHGRGGIPQDSYKAAQYFRAAAQKGDAAGFYNLGLLFFQGRGVREDKRMAVDLWKKAQRQNNKFASVRLGMLAEEERKFDEALQAYRLAAIDTRHDHAIYRQGVMTFRGSGPVTKPDPKNGLALIVRAANLWNPYAQTALIDIYAQGLFVPKNPVEAAKWREILGRNPRTKGGMVPESAGINDKGLADAKYSAGIWLQFHPVPESGTATDYNGTVY